MKTEEEKRLSHIKAVKKHKKKAGKQYLLQLNKNTDVDIIKKMESVPNKTGYLKTLIRQDISGMKAQ